MAIGGVYKIGANHGALALLTALGTPVDDPRADSQDYSQPTPVGDGTVKNLGWLQQNWHWDIMTEAQATQLRSFIGACNILTRANSGTMTEYTAVMLWPKEEPEHYSNRVLDLTVKFIKMVVVT